MKNPLRTKLPVALQELLPAELQQHCTLSPCVRGDMLFEQGGKPVWMLFVIAGEVTLQRAGAQGEMVVLQRARHGFIAEASLQSARYHCDAMVTLAGEVISIPLESVRRGLLSDPAFAGRWITMLNQEVRRLRAQCERMSKRGVKERLLHLIETEGNAGQLRLGVGLKSLAPELGVTHEALYRAVAELERSNVLVRREGYLTLL
ncbi:MAG: Crp/Fnr family transcriptional regulator [Proteobacteria bacterium]|nr:Crp/Fnr family transcriptional regulator [Pseudomonadota bacterium]